MSTAKAPLSKSLPAVAARPVQGVTAFSDIVNVVPGDNPEIVSGDVTAVAP